MARKLRIAASVFFGLLTVALVVLWVRSYSLRDSMTLHVGSKKMQLISATKIVYFNLEQSAESAVKWKHFSQDAPRRWQGDPGPEWWFTTRNGGRDVGIPVWFLAAITGVASISSLLLPRFSLRTLLIATTLVAVGLGLGVWVSR